MDTLKIIQHNVLNWTTRKNNLINTYKSINPEIVLINIHGLKNNENLKIHGYSSYTKNIYNELNDGTSILIKENLKHKIKDDFLTNTIEIIIQTSLGDISIATNYLPPRRPYLPYPDFHKLINNNIPTYIIGDLNAKHRHLGNNSNNQVGKSLIRLINTGKLTHIGLQWHTYHDRNSATTPDIVLSNDKTFHNILIEQGPLTTSDHFPIICTITAKPIEIITTPNYNVNKANWEEFKRITLEETQKIETEGIITKEELDNKIEIWHKILQKSMQKTIPVKRKQTIMKEISIPLIKQIQYYNKNLQIRTNIEGWDRNKYFNY